MQYYDVDPFLKKLGKDRKWLADVTHYTYRTVSIMLSPKGLKSRTAQAMARIEEALHTEEKRQTLPVEIKPVQTLVLEPSMKEFQQWNKKALQEQKLVTDWAVDALNSYARAIPLVAEEEMNYTTPKSKKSST